MILVDTNIFVALLSTKDKNHDRAKIIVREILSGVHGGRFTLDYIFDEAITITWVRTKDMRLIKKVHDLFMGSNALVQMKKFQMSYISGAWEIYKKYVCINRPLSFTDCALIHYAKLNNIEKIASFDSEFDGIITRIH